MKNFVSAWRYNLVFGVLALALVGLCGWMAWLIRHDRPRAIAAAWQQGKVELPLPARPGSIYLSTRGKYVLLAGSRLVPSCYADPSMIAEDQLADVAITVGEALQMDARKVQAELVRRRGLGKFVWVKREIDDDEVEALNRMRQGVLRERKDDLSKALRAVGITHEWRRDYPNAELASGVLGFQLKDGTGGEGLELAEYEHLAARDGLRVVLVDGRRRPLSALPEASVVPADGNNVYLTIDSNIQGYLEKAVAASVEKYSPKWAVGVVVEPGTGRILAMCSVPTFDPNEFSSTDPADRANRVITMPYEPGSALKGVFAASAVDSGACRWDTRFFCENGCYVANRGGRITDHGASYGWLTLEQGLILSSNICLAKVGEVMGNRAIFETLYRFGFGKETGVGLPGESPGIIRPFNLWDGYSLRRVPFGQEVSVTALQLTMAYAALANDGLLLRPILIDHLSDPQGRVIRRIEPEVVRRVVSTRASRQVVQVLQEVVEDEHGTGRKCKSDKWTTFGKTGTAQIAGVGGYVDRAFTGTFVGGAPVSNPKVVCLISIYWPDRSKGHFGAIVAAPFVKDVLEQTLAYLDVPPDKDPEQIRSSGSVVAARR